MHTGLTPSAEIRLLDMKSRALGLLAKAAESGFGEEDCLALGDIIVSAKSFFRYSSFAKMAADVGVSTRVLSDRAKRPRIAPSLFNYQRTLSGLVRICDQVLLGLEPELPETSRPSPAEWLLVPPSLRMKTAHVSELLSSIILQLRGVNDPGALADGLEEVDKAHLISLLETTLVVLKAPMVEAGLLKRSAKWLGHLGTKAADRASMAALGALATEGAHELIKIISGLH